MLRSSRSWLSRNSSVSRSNADRRFSSNSGNANRSGRTDARVRCHSHWSKKPSTSAEDLGSASIRRTWRVSSAGSCRSPRTAASRSGWSGIELHKKKDNREASSSALIRYADAGPISAGSRSILKRKSGSTSIRSSAHWIPVSKVPSPRPRPKSLDQRIDVLIAHRSPIRATGELAEDGPSHTTPHHLPRSGGR